MCYLCVRMCVCVGFPSNFDIIFCKVTNWLALSFTDFTVRLPFYSPTVCNFLVILLRSFTYSFALAFFVLQSSSTTATSIHIHTYYYKWPRTNKTRCWNCNVVMVPLHDISKIYGWTILSQKQKVSLLLFLLLLLLYSPNRWRQTDVELPKNLRFALFLSTDKSVLIYW